MRPLARAGLALDDQVLAPVAAAVPLLQGDADVALALAADVGGRGIDQVDAGFQRRQRRIHAQLLVVRASAAPELGAADAEHRHLQAGFPQPAAFVFDRVHARSIPARVARRNGPAASVASR